MVVLIHIFKKWCSWTLREPHEPGQCLTLPSKLFISCLERILCAQVLDIEINYFLILLLLCYTYYRASWLLVILVISMHLVISRGWRLTGRTSGARVWNVKKLILYFKASIYISIPTGRIYLKLRIWIYLLFIYKCINSLFLLKVLEVLKRMS